MIMLHQLDGEKIIHVLTFEVKILLSYQNIIYLKNHYQFQILHTFVYFGLL